MGGCCSSSEESKPVTKALRTKVRPLLSDLEKDFKEHAGLDGYLNQTELEAVWLKCAERKCGTLSAEEKQVIAKSTKIYFKQMDVDSSGKVSYAEFATFMLGGMEDRGELHKMREEIKKTLNTNPRKLKEIIKTFKLVDKNGDGYVQKEELAEHVTQLAALTNPGISEDLGLDSALCCGTSSGKRVPSEADQKAAAQLLEDMDVDGDGKVDVWELIAHTLGRRKTPVELLLYDISNGVSKNFSPLLLGKKFEAIYHSGVLVFGKEYWYGGKLFATDPPCTDTFGPPLTKSVTRLAASSYRSELQVVHLGYTLCTPAEFKDFIVKELVKKYTPESYDVMTHNCNCFSDEAVHFLTGQGIPKEVIQLPELVMKTPTARLLRPFLNKWLGGFGSDGSQQDGDVAGRVVETPVPARENSESTGADICKTVMGEGDMVLIDAGDGMTAWACVKNENPDGTLETKVLDSNTMQFVTRKVRKEDIKEKLKK